MIYELENQHYSKLIQLLDDQHQNIEVRSVLEHNNPGSVFVDQQDVPTTALIWAYGIEGFYLIGNAHNITFNTALASYVEQSLRPRALARKMTNFEVSGHTEAWNQTIQQIFQVHQLSHSTQCLYRLKQPHSWHLSEMSSTVITRSLLNSGQIKDTDFLVTKIRQFWDSLETFFQKGLGCCWIEDQEIASVCLSGFVAGNTHAIDIETQASFRRQGFGRRVVADFLTLCAQHGVIPHWECMQENLPSAQLAKQMGFSKYQEYTLYAFSFHDEEN